MPGGARLMWYFKIQIIIIIYIKFIKYNNGRYTINFVKFDLFLHSPYLAAILY